MVRAVELGHVAVEAGVSAVAFDPETVTGITGPYDSGSRRSFMCAEVGLVSRLVEVQWPCTGRASKGQAWTVPRRY